MRAHEFMDVPALLDAEHSHELVAEDRWSEVKPQKPVPPKATPIAKAMRPRKPRKPSPPPSPSSP